jgi:hypothetical protein
MKLKIATPPPLPKPELIEEPSVVPADAPELEAGRIVDRLLNGEFTRAQTDVALEPLGFGFCRTCFAYRAVVHECR